MNKRTLNRILKRLDHFIGLNTDSRNDPSPIDPLIHSLTRESIEKLATENPTWTEFDLYKVLFTPIILSNPHRYNELAIFYDWMARQASAENNAEAFELYQKAIHQNALWRLHDSDGTVKPYVSCFHVVGHHSCCGSCAHLTDRVYPINEFLDNLPIPVMECSREDRLCQALPLAIGEARYRFLLERGRLNNEL